MFSTNLPLRCPSSEAIAECVPSKLESKSRKRKKQLYTNKYGGGKKEKEWKTESRKADLTEKNEGNPQITMKGQQLCGRQPAYRVRRSMRL